MAEAETTTEDLRQTKRELKRKLKEEMEQQEAAKKKRAALKQMRYLLSQCERYSNIYKKVVEDQNSKEKNNLLPRLDDVTNCQEVSVREEDVSQFLKYFEGGTLHPYQLDGVIWFYRLYLNSSNGILADEMGLGKTIQVIALICVLMAKKEEGPYLIVAPLSTIPNWESEFKRFAPKIPVVAITGSAEDRRASLPKIKRKYRVDDSDFVTAPVVLVTYQTPLLEAHSLAAVSWKYIIIDEAQRIKNHQCKLSVNLRRFKSENRLALTGTPLQNNLEELWALLNFILPNFFTEMSTFSELLLMQDLKDEEKIIKEEESNNLISKIRTVLSPFMLRRLKTDVLTLVPKKEVVVYCPMSDLQLKYYDMVIERNINGLKGVEEEEPLEEGPRPKRRCTLKKKKYFKYYLTERKIESEVIFIEEPDEEVIAEMKAATYITMCSPMMMFRKIVNHPYLVSFPLDPNREDKREKRLLIDEKIITSSGKMLVLDAMLKRLKADNHKILLFSQFKVVLDLVEELLLMRNYDYRRLDGEMSIGPRAESIRDFNEDPNVFVFLLTTRAGGVGLNLTGADTVIFYDRDWNPQMDIQAQDRCHRIGQTKPVVIYNLISKNTIDDRIVSTGQAKRVLEKIIIQDKRLKSISREERKRTEDVLIELRKALQKPKDNSYMYSNKLEMDRLLDRSDLYAIMANQERKETAKQKKSKKRKVTELKENVVPE